MSEPKSVRAGTYRTLDAYRGIASLGVVAFHWAEMAVHRQPELAGNPLYALCDYGSLGVHIFFVISGYCIANAAASNLRRNDSLGSYVVARLRRIYPVYWAALLLAALFYQGSYMLAKRGVIADNLMTQVSLWERPPLYHVANLTLTMIPLNQRLLLSVAWTLCYEVAFYGIVALAILISARRTERMLTLLHGLTLLSLGGLILAPTHHVFPLNLWPNFGIGVFVYDYLTLRENPARNRAVRIGFAVALFLYAVFAALHNVPVGNVGQFSRTTFTIAAVFALFLLAAYRFDAKWASLAPFQWLGFVGVFSYSLYLTHTITLRIFNQVWQKLNLPGALHPLGFVLAVAFAVAAAYGFFLLFERPFLTRARPKSGAKGAVT